jgi:hypothetical protein
VAANGNYVGTGPDSIIDQLKKKSYHCLQIQISGFIAPDYIAKIEMNVKHVPMGPNLTFSMLTLDFLNVQLYFVKCLG